MDPFLALNTAAAVTTKLRIGTGIALVTQRDPIVTAKMVILDRPAFQRPLPVSASAMGGTRTRSRITAPAFKSRHKLARERIEAMKTIWTQEEPEYHGEFVAFDKMKQCPSRPRSRIHRSSSAARFPMPRERAIRYGDGWIPPVMTGWNATAWECSTSFRKMATDAGRDPATLPISIFRVPDDIDRLRLCEKLGIDRVVFSLPAEKEDKLLPILDRWAELKHQLGSGGP